MVAIYSKKKKKKQAIELLKIHRNTSDLFPRGQKKKFKNCYKYDNSILYILSMSKVANMFGPKPRQTKIKLCGNNNIFQERFFLDTLMRYQP